MTPCPLRDLPTFAERHGASFMGFRHLAGADRSVELDDWTSRHLPYLAELESEWEAAAAGRSLVHADVRADNLLIRADGSVVLVDWPHACVGAGWLDKLGMLPSISLNDGPSAEEVEERLRPFHGIDGDRVDRVLVALAGYFTHQALQPDPPGLPTLRAFQRAQGEVARAWLARRLGLSPTW